MSTILKALQRLEEEEKTGSPANTFPGISARNSFSRRTIIVIVLLACLSTLACTVTIFILLGYNTGVPGQSKKSRSGAAFVAAASGSKPVSPENQHVSAQGEVKQGNKKNILEKPALAVKNKNFPKEPQKEPTLNKNKASKPSLPASIVETTGPARKEKEQKEPSVLIAKKHFIAGESEKEPSVFDSKKPGTIMDSDKKDEKIDILSSSAGLQLQAISWSRDPGKRIAVINGCICKEKSMVDGFLVWRINPDDVIVAVGETKKRLVFGMH